MVVEVMGRHTGWIAVMSGMAGGADVILIPEHPITIEEACADIQRRHERGKDFSIVVVSEGYELTYASGEKQQIAAGGADRPVRPRPAGRRRRRARRARSRSAPATRRASPSSATSSAAARRPRATASSPRASASRPPTSSTRSAGARWPPSAATTIVDVPLQDAVAELKTVPPEFYEAARDLLRLTARFRHGSVPHRCAVLVTVAAEGGQRPAPPRARVYQSKRRECPSERPPARASY